MEKYSTHEWVWEIVWTETWGKGLIFIKSQLQTGVMQNARMCINHAQEEQRFESPPRESMQMPCDELGESFLQGLPRWKSIIWSETFHRSAYFSIWPWPLLKANERENVGGLLSLPTFRLFRSAGQHTVTVLFSADKYNSSNSTSDWCWYWTSSKNWRFDHVPRAIWLNDVPTSIFYYGL